MTATSPLQPHNLPKSEESRTPLTRNDIPTIVQAVLEALPGPPSGPSDTTDPSPNCNPSTTRSDPPSQVPGSFPANQPTTETRDPGTVQPLHSATEQGQSGRGGSICFDPSECYLYYKYCVVTMYARVTHVFVNIIIIITMLCRTK